MVQDINSVKFPDETVKFIHELVSNAIARAIKNGTYKPAAQNNSK